MWDQKIPLLMMAYSGTLHNSTGFSPNFMVFGRELFMPIYVMFGQPYSSEKVDGLAYVQGLRERLEDIYDVAREHIEKSTLRQKRYYNIQAKQEAIPIWRPSLDNE